MEGGGVAPEPVDGTSEAETLVCREGPAVEEVLSPFQLWVELLVLLCDSADGDDLTEQGEGEGWVLIDVWVLGLEDDYLNGVVRRAELSVSSFEECRELSRGRQKGVKPVTDEREVDNVRN